MEREMTDTSTAIVCNLSSSELRDRKGVFRAELKPFLTQETYAKGSSSLVFSKPGTNWDMLERFSALERECCPVFTFEITETQSHFRVAVTGPKGSEDMVRDVFSQITENGCGCERQKTPTGSNSKKYFAGFITLCAIGCAIPPTLAAVGFIGVATGAYMGKVVEAAVLTAILLGIGLLLVQYIRKRKQRRPS